MHCTVVHLHRQGRAGQGRALNRLTLRKQRYCWKPYRMAENDIVASAFGRLYMNYLSTVCRKPCRMAGDDSWKCYNLIYFHNTDILFWYMILISLHFWSKFFATLNIMWSEIICPKCRRFHAGRKSLNISDRWETFPWGQKIRQSNYF